jgi:hypothetical protein
MPGDDVLVGYGVMVWFEAGGCEVLEGCRGDGVLVGHRVTVWFEAGGREVLEG